MADEHRYFLEFDGSYGPTRIRVECPYDLTDTDRPCWPHHEIGDGWEPDLAPQDACVYEDWIQNCDAEDILHGSTTIELRAEAKWNGGYFELHLLPSEPDMDHADASRVTVE